MLSCRVYKDCGGHGQRSCLVDKQKQILIGRFALFVGWLDAFNSGSLVSEDEQSFNADVGWRWGGGGGGGEFGQ